MSRAPMSRFPSSTCFRFLPVPSTCQGLPSVDWRGEGEGDRKREQSEGRQATHTSERCATRPHSPPRRPECVPNCENCLLWVIDRKDDWVIAAAAHRATSCPSPPIELVGREVDARRALACHTIALKIQGE